MSTSPDAQPFFSFPNPVNDVAARVIAGGVVLLSLVAIVARAEWLVVLIALGFAARVAAGPKASPLGLFATRVIVPRLGIAPRWTPGPPKRFAQTIGVVFSAAAAVLTIVVGSWAAATVVLAALTAAAFLEASFGFCLGCRVFAILMRIGVIPADVCLECNNIWARYGTRPEALTER